MADNTFPVVSFITLSGLKEYYGMIDIQDYLRFSNVPAADKYTTRTGTVDLGDGDIFTCKSMEEMTQEEMTIIFREIAQGCIADYDDALLHYLCEHSEALKAHFLLTGDALYQRVKEHLEAGDAEQEHDEDEDEPVEITLRDGTKVHADARYPEWRKIQ